ncbi:hypothetical protein [Chloroflexus sp.]|uniref:hypothetical protein n=1 Tax=Chloroflexus sp. TaxID=1904827 RepID=UPI00298EEBCA|nr:hypothetical protein [Chloroflexus sp.]MCX7859904.1 hypothetical protein [Chloroflexus sp.]MDW8404383.1 hypothetical protein [Chloroflexus sp.]
MSGFGAFQPACRPLLRGGLPHANPATVAQLICQYLPQTPAWPLPPPRALADTPFALAAQGLPGMQIDVERDRLAVEHEILERDAARVGLAYLRSETQFAALTGPAVTVLEELLRRLNAEERKPLLFKYETIGPVSLSLALTDDHDRPLAYEPEWCEILLYLCSLRVAWQHEQVQGYATRRLAMIDEPFLDALSTPLCPLTWDDGIDLLNRLFANLPGRRGLFLSGVVQWAEILRLPVDVIGCHLAEHLQPMLAVAAPLAEFLADGGCVAWGVIPVETRLLANAQSAGLRDLVLQAIQQVAETTGVEAAVVQRQSFLSFTGSLAYLSPAQAEQALQLCAETAQLVQQAVGLRDV